jgi:hypothetical protein
MSDKEMALFTRRLCMMVTELYDLAFGRYAIFAILVRALMACCGRSDSLCRRPFKVLIEYENYQPRPQNSKVPYHAQLVALIELETEYEPYYQFYHRGKLRNLSHEALQIKGQVFNLCLDELQIIELYPLDKGVR